MMWAAERVKEGQSSDKDVYCPLCSVSFFFFSYFHQSHSLFFPWVCEQTPLRTHPCNALSDK